MGIDFLNLLLFFQWLLKPSCNLIGTLGIFYAIRSIIFAFTIFPLPSPYLFDFSYPSLLIPIDPTNDLFFSGHTGNMVICYITYKRTGQGKLAQSSLIWVIFTMVILHLTGGHYTNDLLFGFLWSLTSFIVGYRVGYSLCYYVLLAYIKTVGKFKFAREPLEESEVEESIDSKKEMLL